MATLTEHEQNSIDQANASGLTPVVFIHGLWLLPSSWDRWRALFEEAGYSTVAPGWPDDPRPSSRPRNTQKRSRTRRSARSPTTSRRRPGR